MAPIFSNKSLSKAQTAELSQLSLKRFQSSNKKSFLRKTNGNLTQGNFGETRSFNLSRTQSQEETPLERKLAQTKREKVTALNLSGVGLKRNQLSQIAEFVRRNPKVDCLDLSSNFLSDELAECFLREL